MFGFQCRSPTGTESGRCAQQPHGCNGNASRFRQASNTQARSRQSVAVTQFGQCQRIDDLQHIDCSDHSASQHVKPLFGFFKRCFDQPACAFRLFSKPRDLLASGHHPNLQLNEFGLSTDWIGWSLATQARCWWSLGPDRFESDRLKR